LTLKFTDDKCVTLKVTILTLGCVNHFLVSGDEHPRYENFAKISNREILRIFFNEILYLPYAQDTQSLTVLPLIILQIQQTNIETMYRVLNDNVTLSCPFTANPTEVKGF
jgi:hypothetical protein